MNRAPSNKDRWWGKMFFQNSNKNNSNYLSFLFFSDEHTRRCGGQFEKVKEPENYKSKSTKKRTTNELTSDKASQSSTSSQSKI